jgi:hypothetical protein
MMKLGAKGVFWFADTLDPAQLIELARRRETRGHQYRRPLATMRAYLDGMDKAAGNAPALAEPPPTVLAALGPQMTALVGSELQAFIPIMLPPEHTAAGRVIKALGTIGALGM